MSDSNIDKPIIRKYDYNINIDIKQEILKQNDSSEENKLITRFPTVYIVIDKIHGNRKKFGQFKAYVGETNNIVRRTEEHLNSESEDRTDWTELNNSKNAKIIVIAHKEFNKSLTLDVENQLMKYLLSDDAIGELNNRRSNDQDLYFTRDHFRDIFQNIWDELSKRNENIFPSVDDITNSAIFKASPFHKLTDEQLDARDKIIDKIKNIRNGDSTDNLIIIKGSAGTGKTVLLSSLFSELNKPDNQEAYILVNHDEQVKVYENIASKIGIKTKMGDSIANKPTMFLNQHLVDEINKGKQNKVDISLIDEAHLLFTQGNQSYQGKNQLGDIMNVSNVVVAVLDPMQVLKNNGYLEQIYYDTLINNAKKNNNLIELSDQNRMVASKETINWIEDIVTKNEINKIPNDEKYDLRVFGNVNDMYDEIKKHNDNIESLTKGLSRLVATYDWKYNKNKKDIIKLKNGNEFADLWRVKIGDKFNLPWNYQLPVEKKYKGLSWAEQPQTINEVGSTFTIQGFDLNYCGVIIGPSVKFRDGKIVYDKSESYDKKVTGRRTLKNDEKKDVSSELIRNQLNVLLKRGVHGLFIYAVDDELRKELLRQSK
ncbi:DNA/RNA helicase domain-containing protein [Apilactobacillus kunkeei]|uniref:DNA/RNA helicase domain-containing protein n=1 Tax=Apilactobacillus kunkeei TaxID=148814 RepID=UPI0040336676